MKSKKYKMERKNPTKQAKNSTKCAVSLGLPVNFLFCAYLTTSLREIAQVLPTRNALFPKSGFLLPLVYAVNAIIDDTIVVSQVLVQKL